MLSRRCFSAALAGAGLVRPARAQTPFAAFLEGVRADAVAGGVRAETVERAFAGLKPNAKILELDSYAPEKTQSWAQYRDKRVTEARVAAGRQAFGANAAVLREIERRYGVDPGVIVAIWGVESAFGGFTGGFSVVEALATLGADGRHDGFFRTELLAALRILDHGDVTPGRMKGSYAGAMGQPQFMPSSYLAYAVDFDGTGKRDIWENRDDSLASIANYLAQSGWRRGEPWGQAVRVPPGFAAGPAGRDARRTLAEWTELGVTRADGTGLSHPEALGALVMPDGAGGDAFMTYPNFGVIRLYNPSDLYALSVGVLGSRIVPPGASY